MPSARQRFVSLSVLLAALPLVAAHDPRADLALVPGTRGATIVLPAPPGGPRRSIEMSLLGAARVAPVAAAGRMTSPGVYPGIDVVWHTEGGALEYDFVVAPGADPAAIRIAFSGIEGLSLGAEGDLVVETTSGAVRHGRPRLFQETGGTRCDVDGAFELRGDGTVGFQAGRYDPSRTLVIDPTIVYADVQGLGRGSTGSQDLAVDAQGNAVMVGYYPWDFDRGLADFFVTRLGPQGALVSEAHLGGTYADEPRAVALDAAGNIYVTGVTWSTRCCRPFPVTADAFQIDSGGDGDAFLVKLDPTGHNVLHGTFLGGSGKDTGTDVQVEAGGRILLAGTTASLDFPTRAPFQPASGGGRDAFVATFAADGTLLFSSYLGGSGDDAAARTELLGRRLLVSGTTSSSDFPVRSALQASYGGGASDAFLAVVGDGALQISTYLGGSGAEQAWGVGRAFGGYAYVAGSTSSTDFPTSAPLQATLSFPPEADAFLAKLPGDLSRTIFSTYLAADADVACPSSDRAPCGGIAVDAGGNAFVTAHSGGGRGLLSAKVAADGSARRATAHGSGGHGIALRQTQLGLDVLVAGATKDFLFPTWKTQGPRAWYEDEVAWLAKLIDGPNPPAQYEEGDARIAYSGPWQAVVSPEASGGRALRSRTAGAKAVVTFTGTGLQVIGRRDYASGIAEVSQDWNASFPLARLDAYAAPAEGRAVVLSFSGLPAGVHTLSLEVTGTRGTRSQGEWVWVDGIRILP